MIAEKTMYTVKCDGCGKESGGDNEICAWDDADFAVTEAVDFMGWIKADEEHYCPDCIQME